MRHTQHHLRSAPIAIAAILALGTAPGMAQTAPAQPAPTPSASDPIVLQSPIAPPAAAPTPAPTTPVVAPRTTQPQQPTIVLDVPPAPATTSAPEPTANQRNTRAAAPAEEPRRTTREPAAPRQPVSERSAIPTAVTSTVTSPDASVSSTNGEALAVDAAASPLPTAEAAPVALAAEPTPAAGPDWVAIIALALAGLIPLGAIFLAFAWFRRRSRRIDAIEPHEDAYVEEPAAEREPVPAPVAREPAPTPAPAPQAAAPSLTFAREPVSVATTAPAAASARRHPLDGYKGLPNAGAAVSLPAELPESFEERDALLKRMIAAEPDRANPFRSTKARAKRARLILQSLGRTFENAKPRFDLSQYTRNWPALAGRRTSFA